jgi:3-methylcrotonyl-CoA carboxylase alpha subunit
MGATAVNIAREAGYVNAGTMEFILDADNHFYFLEMNTRLQVEHPITELVAGIDLVRHQLLIAAGEPLQLTQEQIHPRGHAIEMRLYAEDPAQNFLPATGTVTRFIQPVGPGIRIDSGIESGDEITQFYDPMIAKMIVYAEDRPAAIARMQDVLAQSAVFGVKTNLSLLNSIAAHPAFNAGLTHTGFLQEHNLLSANLSQENVFLPAEVLLAAALYDNTADAGASSGYNGHTPFAKQSSVTPWQTLGPWRMIGETRRITYMFQGKEYNIALKPTSAGTGTWSVQINNQGAENIAYMLGNDDLVWLRREANQARTYVQHTQDKTQVFFRGQLYTLERHRPPTVEAAGRDSNVMHIQKVLAAPMAGTIIKVQAHDGDTVEQRQVLVILSAMKMEHSIAAPYAGKVRRIYVQEGAVVKGGAAIVEME